MGQHLALGVHVHIGGMLQVLALFNKAMRKLHSHLRAVKEAVVARQLPRPAGLPAALLAASATAGECLPAVCH